MLVGSARFSGLNSMRDLMLLCGLGTNWQDRSAGASRADWDATVRLKTGELAAVEVAQFDQRSSLAVYRSLDHSYVDGTPQYLDDRSNLPGTRLLCKFRLGYAWLMKNIGRYVCYVSRKLWIECPLSSVLGEV